MRCTPAHSTRFLHCCCLSHCAELAIGNIVRRVLHMIREEQQQEQLGHSEGGIAAQDAADKQAGVSRYGRGWCLAMDTTCVVAVCDPTAGWVHTMTLVAHCPRILLPAFLPPNCTGLLLPCSRACCLRLSGVAAAGLPLGEPSPCPTCWMPQQSTQASLAASAAARWAAAVAACRSGRQAAATARRRQQRLRLPGVPLTKSRAGSSGRSSRRSGAARTTLLSC